MSPSNNQWVVHPIQPTRIHRDRIASKRDRFWAEYSLNLPQADERLVVPSVRFELDSIQRRPARRTMSVGPTSRKSWPPQMHRKSKTKTSGVQWLRRVLATSKRALHYVGALPVRCMRRITHIRVPLKRVLPSKRILTTGAIAIATAGLYLKLNHDFALAKAAQPSIITEYSGPHSTSWMHADSPARILGLPDPIGPVVVNRLKYEAAFRSFARKFHPDKATANGFAKNVSHAIYMRGFQAKAALDTFYLDPTCWKNWIHVTRFNVSGDGLPSYDSPCRCSYPRAVLETVLRATVPFPLQPDPPQTMEELAKHCPPCDFSVAAAQWAEFNEENRPPPLHRVRHAIPPSRVYEDPRVRYFKGQDREKAVTKFGVQNYWSDAVQRMWVEAGWAVPGDFVYGALCRPLAEDLLDWAAWTKKFDHYEPRY